MMRNPQPNTSGLSRRGRPKGALNKATREFKEWAQKFYKSKPYRDSAQQRILDGKAPQLETYLAQLLYGKPREVVEIDGGPLMPKIVNIFNDGDSSTHT